MKKIFYPVTILVLGLILSGCSFLGQKNQPPSAQTETLPVEEKGGVSAPQGKGKGTESYTFKALKAAIDLGIPLKCTYQISNNQYEGFVKGKQWRGKIKTAEGKIGEILIKDNCIYSWDNSKNQGGKICSLRDVWEASPPGQTQEAEIEYFCVPAIVDDSQFIPPANINFIDIDQLQKETGAMDMNETNE